MVQVAGRRVEVPEAIGPAPNIHGELLPEVNYDHFGCTCFARPERVEQAPQGRHCRARRTAHGHGLGPVKILNTWQGLQEAWPRNRGRLVVLQNFEAVVNSLVVLQLVLE